MKRSKYTESQIVFALHQAETGTKVVEVGRKMGISEAIERVYPKADVQSCIVHQIRSSCKYVASKDQKEFMRNLKKVYRANTKDLAELALDERDSGKPSIRSSSPPGRN